MASTDFVNNSGTLCQTWNEARIVAGARCVVVGVGCCGSGVVVW